MTITKSELVATLVQDADLKRLDAIRFVDDFFEVISKALANGEDVKIPGFGSFVLRDKGARFGRNPKTGVEFPIEARRVVSFRTSNLLKLAIRDKYKEQDKSA